MPVYDTDAIYSLYVTQAYSKAMVQEKLQEAQKVPIH